MANERRGRGRPPHPDILTPREWQVLALLREGLTNEQIAARLDISLATAKYHVSEIISKLGVQTREEAASWAPPPERGWWERALAPLAAMLRRLGPLTATKAAIAAGAVGVLAALAGLSVLTLAARDRGEHPAIAQPSPQVNAPSSTDAPTSAGLAVDLGDLAFAYLALDGAVWLAADGRSRQVISESLLATPDFAESAANVKWSPNGRRLAFGRSSLLGGSPAPGATLWVLDPSSGDRFRLDEAVLDFDWMNDGEHIYYQKAPSEYLVADVSSGDKGKIGDYHVSWSHDETRFVFTGRIGEHDPARPWESIALFLGTADGAPSQRLVDWAGAPDWLFNPWSPDDRLLVYFKQEHGGSALVGDICAWDLETSGEVCLGEFTSDEFPDWAPADGRYVFHNYEIDPAGGTFRELFPRPGALIGWSPDATKVAYVEGLPFGQGPRSLVILDPGAGARFVVHTSSAGTSHAGSPGYWGEWSPDGRFLAFIGLDDAAAATLFVADAATGDVIHVRAGFDVGDLFFAYAPDSSRLLIQDGRYESPSIWIADASGRNPIKVAEGYAIGHGPDFAPWRPEP